MTDDRETLRGCIRTLAELLAEAVSCSAYGATPDEWDSIQERLQEFMESAALKGALLLLAPRSPAQERR